MISTRRTQMPRKLLDSSCRRTASPPTSDRQIESTSIARRHATLLIGGLLAAAICPAYPAAAANVAGIELPESTRVTPDGPQLRLNGAGQRKILMFDVYAMGLYLPKRARSMDEVLAQAGPKRMLMVMLRDNITASQVRDQVVARIGDGSQPTEMSVMKSRIDELDRIIQSESVINRGGTIALDYVPDQGTVIRVNDHLKGKPIEGADFYGALLRIWLGQGAKSSALREALLGKG